MKKSIDSWNALPAYMKSELGIILWHTTMYGIFMVALTKLQGLVLVGSVFAAMYGLNKVLGLGTQVVKTVPTSTKYLVLLWIDVVTTILLFSYGAVDTTVWIVALVISGGLHGVFIQGFFIDYDVILRETTSKKGFMDVQYLEQLMFSIAGITGAALAFFTTHFLMSDDPKSLDGIADVFFVAAVTYGAGTSVAIRQYFLYYRDLNVHEKKKDKVDEEPMFKYTLDQFKQGLIPEDKK